jgi:hypothetical protein
MNTLNHDKFGKFIGNNIDASAKNNDTIQTSNIFPKGKLNTLDRTSPQQVLQKTQENHNTININPNLNSAWGNNKFDDKNKGNNPVSIGQHSSNNQSQLSNKQNIPSFNQFKPTAN